MGIHETVRRSARIARAASLLAGLALLTSAARADDDERIPRVPLLPAYEQECGSCHIAFPPGLLPATSWRRIMNSLDKHYGTDASLDGPAVAAEISAWLGAHAGTARRVAVPPPEDRITRAAWFVRKHDEVPAAAWARASIRSAANCAACHTTAAQGNYSERNVKIPK